MHTVLTRITATIGVELAGLDLRQPLEPSDVAMIERAVAEHHVVVIRDQILSVDQHVAVAESFGPIQISPAHRLTGITRKVSTIEDTAERAPAGFPWHTDLSWVRDTPSLGFLNAVTIPEYGGDTLWASTAAVYDALSEPDRMRCDHLTAMHAPDPTLLASVQRHHGPDVAEQLVREHPPIEHQLVRRGSTSGRRSVFLSPLSMLHIVGPAGADGELLTRLNRHLDDPHVQMRWRWQAGDFVIWDETSTCHRALTDHHPQRRVMRRCVTESR